GQLLPEREDLARGHQRRQPAQLFLHRGQFRLVRVDRHLPGRARTPAPGVPVGGEVHGLEGAVWLGHGGKAWSNPRMMTRCCAASISAATNLPGPGPQRSFLNAACSANPASNTNQTRLQAGMDRPRKVQSMLPQSPVPVSTLRTRVAVSMVSRMKDSGAPQDGT